MRTAVARLMWTVVVALTATVVFGQPQNFITVYSDGWHFADGGNVFIPVGANYLPNDAAWAPDYFSDCYWDPDKIERDFAAFEALDLNVLKVVLSFGNLLPTGQGTEFATLNPNVLDRFDVMLAKANAHDIRLIVVAQPGWHQIPQWYYEYDPMRGSDNRRVVENMWQQLAARYANEKAIMAWSLSVEIKLHYHDWQPAMVPRFQEWLERKYGSIGPLQTAWGCTGWPAGYTCPSSFADVNLPFCKSGGSCVGKSTDQFDGRNREHVNNPPVVTWRDFLEGTPQNEHAAPSGSSASALHQWLLDYVWFRQQLALEWMKVQADAIRSVDSNHLVSAGLGMWTIPIRRHGTNPNPACELWWPSDLQEDVEGYEGIADMVPFDARELQRFVDFVDIHFYPNYPYGTGNCNQSRGHGQWPGYPTVPVVDEYADMTATCAAGGGCDDHFEYLRALVRWAYVGKPLLLGEYGQITNDDDQNLPEGPERVSAYNTQVLLRLGGDVSGYLVWGFHNFPDTTQAGVIGAYNGLFEDPYVCPGPPTGGGWDPLCPTPWGLKLSSLARDIDQNITPFAQFVNGPHRNSTYTKTVDTSVLTSEHHLETLGGPLDPVPGQSILEDSISIGTIPNPNVVDVQGIPVNTDLDDRLAPWDCRVVSHSIPEVVLQQNSYPSQITLRNTGTATWTPGTHCLLEMPSGTCHQLSSPVAGSTEVTFNLDLSSGAREGCRTLTWQMVDTSVFPPEGRPFGEMLTVGMLVNDASSLGPNDPVIVGTGGGDANPPKVKSYVLDQPRSLWVETASFSAFNPGDRYGANVAIGNLDGTGRTELAVAHGPQLVGGSTPSGDIELFRRDFTTQFDLRQSLGTIGPFFGYPDYGLNIAIGDVDRVPGTCSSWFARGDELIVAPGPRPGIQAQVLVLKVDVCNVPATYTVWKTILLPPNTLGGPDVAAVDVDGDLKREVVVGTGRGYTSRVFVYKYNGSSGAFDLMGQYDPFPPQTGGISTILEETHSVYDYGESAALEDPCVAEPHFAANVSGGDVIPDCPETAREEIVATLGPYSDSPITPHNEGWLSVAQYDSSSGEFVVKYSMAGYETVEYGLNSSVADINGDGNMEILTASGPDSAASSLMHSFGTPCIAGMGGKVRLLQRREMSPFVEDYGASISSQPSLPSCQAAASGGPGAATAALQGYLETSPEDAFISQDAQGQLLGLGAEIHGAASAWDLPSAIDGLVTFAREADRVLVDSERRSVLRRHEVRSLTRISRAMANRSPRAIIEDVKAVSAYRSRGAVVTLDGSRSTDPDSGMETSDIISWRWWDGDRFLGSGPVIRTWLSVGSHDVTLEVSDTVGRTSHALAAAEVTDVEPPEVRVNSTPDVLWPPDGRMVEVVYRSSGEDLVDGALPVVLTGFESSEPDDAPGDGDGSTVNDVVVTPEGKVYVRAERDTAGVGRIYTVHFAAVDSSGNLGRSALQVRVPLIQP